MNPCPLVTRRRFMVGLGATLLTVACGGKAITVLRRDPSTTSTALLPAGAADAPLPGVPAGTVVPPDRTLVVIEMGGGNDSLSMVVPHADPRYHDLRRSLAIDDPIDLDGEIGFHPALTELAAGYRRGRVAIVEGVGTEHPDLSHFVSMRRWWDGTEQPDGTGWLGRFLDSAGGSSEPLAGITIGPGPTPAMLGLDTYVVNVADASGLAAEVPWWVDDRDELMGLWRGFAPAAVPDPVLDPVRRAIAVTADADQRLRRSLRPLEAAIETGRVPAEESGTLSGHLQLAAALIASEARPRVLYVHGFGDYDTHEDQSGRHGALMADLDRGLAAFWATLEEASADERALVMTTSEFGRRPEDNDGGTDHGTAADHLVMGPSVEGGRHGERPSLRRLDADGNLAHTVDFRSVYATVLDGWFGASHEDLLRGRYERLDFLG